MSDKILIVAPSAYAIDISRYGGIERVTYLISQEMAKQGVDVTVAAPRGSLLPWGVKHLDFGPANDKDFVGQEALAFSILRPSLKDYSVVLDLTHAKLTGRYTDCPQMSVIWHMPSMIQPPEPKWNIIALSRYQAESYYLRQGRKARVLDTHCVAPELQKLEVELGNRFIFIGRIHPTKGALEAARLCNRLGIPLDIVGAITPAEPPLYVAQVKKEAERGDVVFMGELTYDALTETLSRARALIFPIAQNYEEAHSHKSVDALCLGVPVISFKQGALPEVIEHGVDGYLAGSENSIQDLEYYMKKVDDLNRAVIKKRAWERWHPKVVVGKLMPLLTNVARGARWG